MGLVMDHNHDLHASSPPSSKKAAAEIIGVPGGLPAGYRFRPTDVELVKHYLMVKAFNPASPLPAFILCIALCSTTLGGAVVGVNKWQQLASVAGWRALNWRS
ncbi:hypothetical protein LINGRAHAP2_LOCUS9724 [Linum grandiflorum]